MTYRKLVPFTVAVAAAKVSIGFWRVTDEVVQTFTFWLHGVDAAAATSENIKRVVSTRATLMRGMLEVET